MGKDVCMKKAYVSISASPKNAKMAINEVVRILNVNQFDVTVTNDGCMMKCGSYTKVVQYTSFVDGLKNLKSANVFIAVIESGVELSGETIWEAGAAYSNEIPVVIIAENQVKIPHIMAKTSKIVLSTMQELQEYILGM